MENGYYVSYIKVFKGIPSEDVRTFKSLKDLSEWLAWNNEHTNVGTILITRIEKAEEP